MAVQAKASGQMNNGQLSPTRAVRECQIRNSSGKMTALDSDVALYVAPEGNRSLALWDKTNATRQTVGKVDLAWRGVIYDVYTLQKVTGFKPVLSPPPDDPLYVAAPN